MTSTELREVACLLEKIEQDVECEMGYTHISGKFVKASLAGYTKKSLNIVLKYGVKSDCTNISYKEKLRADRETMQLIQNIK